MVVPCIRHLEPLAATSAVNPGAGATVDYSRKWVVLAAVSMGVFLATIDGSIVAIALPVLVKEFDTSFSVVQWVVLSYLLTWATLSVSIGRVGDMVGKKKLYVLGFGVFTAASMAVGLAPSIPWLIGLRAVQAVGAAMVLSLGIGILTEAFPDSERGQALGIIGAMVSIGAVTGPTLGGLILQNLSWRWIFFVNLPIGIIGTIVAIRFIPDSPPPGGQRFDFVGATLFLASLLSILLALTFSQERGFRDPTIIAMLAFGVGSLVAFVVVERLVDEPMVDLTMFSNVDFTVGLTTGFLTFMAVRGLTVTGPFLLTDTLGFELRQAGLILAASPIALGIIAPLSGRAADRYGPRSVTVIGLTVLFSAYLLVQLVDTTTTGVGFALILAPIGLGMGIFQSPNNSAIMGSVPPDQLGVAGGMLGLNRLLGQVVGFGILITYWSSRVSAGSPDGASPEAQASAFRDTNLGGAAAVLLALMLAVWALRRDRTRQRALS